MKKVGYAGKPSSKRGKYAPKEESKYTGILSKPMQVRPGSSAADYRDEFDERCNELFRFYKIEQSDPHSWEALAIACVRARPWFWAFTEKRD